MLTPLQEQVAAIVASLDEAQGFALAGGGAMILRGYVDRSTRDLDFFGLAPSDVDRLAPAAMRALSDAGLGVQTVRVNPGFVRLVIEDGGDRTELDLAADARLFPAEAGPLAPTLAGEELATDKVPLSSVGRKHGTSSTSWLWKAASGSLGCASWPPRRTGASHSTFSL